MATFSRIIFAGEINISSALTLFDIQSTQCLQCDNPAYRHQVFCVDCLKKIRPLMCSRNQMGWELPNGVRFRSASYYSGPIARYIQMAKSQPFGYLPKYLFNPIQEVLAYWCEEFRHSKIDLISYVPGNSLRCFVETDLSQTIAEKISYELKKPLAKLLIRPWSLRQQKNLKFEERWKSRGDQFYVNKSLSAQYKGRKVLLIDDVCTSGSSLFHSSQALIRCGLICTQCFVLSCSPSFSRINGLFDKQSRPMISPIYGRGI